jgi:hypothetical protein
MKTLLLILVTFIALTTSITGLILMSIPDGNLLQLSIDVLKDSPFHDFRLPGLLMFVFLGLINLFAVFCLMVRDTRRYNASIAGAVLVILWIAFQYLFIGQSFWLDIIVLLIAVAIILLSLQLKGKSLI